MAVQSNCTTLTGIDLNGGFFLGYSFHIVRLQVLLKNIYNGIRAQNLLFQSWNT